MSGEPNPRSQPGQGSQPDPLPKITATKKLDIRDVFDCKTKENTKENVINWDSSACSNCTSMYYNKMFNFDHYDSYRVLFCFHMRAIDSNLFGHIFLKDLVELAKSKNKIILVTNGTQTSNFSDFGSSGKIEYSPYFMERMDPNLFREPTQGVLQREKIFYRIKKSKDQPETSLDFDQLTISKCFVYLFHELVHCYHYLSEGSFKPSCKEEWRTVGLYEYEFDSYTENRFRKALNLIARPCYKYKDPKKIIDPRAALGAWGFKVKEEPGYYEEEMKHRKEWGRPEQSMIQDDSWEYCHRTQEDMKNKNWQCNNHLKAYKEKYNIKKWDEASHNSLG